MKVEIQITEKKMPFTTIVSMLYDIIELYEPTEGYNTVPENAEEKDCREYLSNLILNVRKELSSLSPEERELADILERIIDETEFLVNNSQPCSSDFGVPDTLMPGVPDRWKEFNDKWDLFNILSFEMARRDITLFEAYREYFENIIQKWEVKYSQCSNRRIIQKELFRTFGQIVIKDLEKYL